MRFDRLTVLTSMLEIGAVPIFTPRDLEGGRRVIAASVASGMRVVEITNRKDGMVRMFADLARWCEDEYPDVVLGAGTVVDAPTAALFIDAGANFVVGPTLSADVARLCNRRRVAYLPGCGSATEISAAEELGAEIVKLFPAAAFDGAAFIRGILGPSPWSRLMPTNIVASQDVVRSWFAAGAACVGVGGSLIAADPQPNPDPAVFMGRCLEFIDWVRSSRSGREQVRQATAATPPLGH